MSDRPPALEAELRALRVTVDRLEARVARLEAGPDRMVQRPPAREPGVQDESAEPEGVPSLGSLAERAGANLGAGWIGAMLLALAGAFLLRSFTESGALPRSLGTLLGLGYALVWAIGVPVLAAFGRRRPATASGLVSTLVVLPLLWENCVRYHALSAPVAAVILLGAAGLLLVCAEWHRLHLVTSMTVLGSGSAALALAIGSADYEPFVGALVLLGAVAAFRGPGRGGVAPWFAYAFANLGVLLVLLSALEQSPAIHPGVTTGLLAFFAVGSLAGFVRWSRRSGRAGAQACLQGSFATLFGFGGALWISSGPLPVAATVLAVSAMGIGAAGYVFLIATFRWSRENRWPFLLYSSLGLALVSMGALTVLSEPGWFFALLAILLATLGVGLKRVSPTLHAAVSVILAVATGGTAGMIYRSLAAPPAADNFAVPLTASSLVCWATACICAVLPLKTDSPIWPAWMPRTARAAVVLAALLGLDAVMVALLAPTLGAAHDIQALAALRSGALSVSVIALAAAVRWHPLQPARILVWPLLVAIGFKLLIEDLRHGRAMTLAVAFLLAGTALIFSSFLLRRGRDSGTGNRGTEN